MPLNTKYIIITPARDEEQYIEKTISSVILQTFKPVEWIIVNDGSVDNTGTIIDKYATEYSWIKTVHRSNRGFRKAGGGVVEAFYTGYNALTCSDWEFIVKLDGDLSFEPDYFEKCFRRFEANPKLGVGGGMIYHSIDGKLEDEKGPRFHVRGATKIYRKACWDAIGGFIEAPGWDTLDEVKANMLGWQTQTLEDLQLLHHRYTGAADGSWRNCVKNGRANYISGYHPLFMLLKCTKRMFQKPFFIGSIGLFYGFISGYTKRISQVDDRVLIKYLRKQQLKRLIFGSSIWK